MEDSPAAVPQRLLSPLDRVAEIVFGLIMAVTIIGSLSIATAGRNEVRTVMFAALGCNVAWGLVDAVMYLVRTLTERTRIQALAMRIMSADAPSAHRIIASTLPDQVRAIVGDEELESMRRRLLALPPKMRAGLDANDYLSALGIFLLVVLATFPVAAPFVLIDDVARAMRWSQAITLVMLFAGGLLLGRHAGLRRPLLTGIAMSLFGALLIAAVKALGG